MASIVRRTRLWAKTVRARCTPMVNPPPQVTPVFLAN
jgi:hypothetical protein